MMTVEIISVDGLDFAEARWIRQAVFVDEQGVDPAHEFDDIDGIAVHFLARCDGVAAGTARLYGEGGVGRIGRVAVLSGYRKRGVGEALMRAAIDVAGKRGYGVVVLHSQVQAAPFYAKLGFVAEGEEFMEEGIPHVGMKLEA